MTRSARPSRTMARRRWRLRRRGTPGRRWLRDPRIVERIAWTRLDERRNERQRDDPVPSLHLAVVGERAREHARRDGVRHGVGPCDQGRRISLSFTRKTDVRGRTRPEWVNEILWTGLVPPPGKKRRPWFRRVSRHPAWGGRCQTSGVRQD